MEHLKKFSQPFVKQLRSNNFQPNVEAQLANLKCTFWLIYLELKPCPHLLKAFYANH